jgi:glycosyltransferase involved in cell wall biosynthesis
VHGLVQALVELGHEVHVFTTNVDGSGVSNVLLGQPVELDGVKVWYFPSNWPRLYRSPAMAQALSRMVSSFDVVHLHSVFLWPTWAAAVACRKASVPYVLSPRGMMVKQLIRMKSQLAKSAWITLIERANLENASAIHVTADIESHELRKFGFSLPPVVAIPNGVTLPTIGGSEVASGDILTLAQRQPLVLSLGRLDWKKNLAELVRAVTQIPHGHVGIAGNDEDGYAKTLLGLTSSLELNDRVTILPRAVLGFDKEALMAACKLFVMPSLSENFGNAALEAAIRGKPLLVSEEAGVATMVRDYQCGLTCRPNADDIGRAIKVLLENPERSKIMGERGRTAALSSYTWPVIARQMSTLYDSVVKRGRP